MRDTTQIGFEAQLHFAMTFFLTNCGLYMKTCRVYEENKALGLKQLKKLQRDCPPDMQVGFDPDLRWGVHVPKTPKTDVECN